MNPRKTAGGLTVAVILGFVVLSGPLVPTVDLTRESAESYEQTGGDAASIELVSVTNESIRIGPGRYGTGYYFSAPTVTVRVNSVRGRPKLVYEIRVAGLGQNFARLAFLREADAGRTVQLAIDRQPVSVEKLDSQTYQSELSLRLRLGNESRVLYRQNVTTTVSQNDGD